VPYEDTINAIAADAGKAAEKYYSVLKALVFKTPSSAPPPYAEQQHPIEIDNMPAVQEQPPPSYAEHIQQQELKQPVGLPPSSDSPEMS